MSAQQPGGGAGAEPFGFDGAGDYQPGDLIPGTDFVVRKFLGEGGHASAYECENRIGKRVAVKVIHRHLAARGDLVEKMVVEARRTVQLRHRNIVEVHNAGMTGGDRPRAFIEMELLNGSNGRQLLLNKKRLEVPHALDVLIDVCHALDAAHRTGVIHQDLKPDNIFIHLDEWSGKAITKLLDFGVARMLGQAHDGTFEGTLAYAAPEQVRGEPVTPATDLYALGVIAFELIVGQRPFEAAEARDEGERGMQASAIQVGFFDASSFTHNLVDAILGQAPPQLCDFIRLPRPLEDLVLQLLEKDPAKRPESAKSVATALHAIRQSPALPKSAVTTQALLLDAVQAAKMPVAKEATLRMGVDLATPPPDGATVPDAPLMPEALSDASSNGGAFPAVDRSRARTPTPPRESGAPAALATERLPSAPGLGEVRIERAVPAGIVRTLEPVTDRPAAQEEVGPESTPREVRARRARRLVFAALAVAGIILSLGAVAAMRRGASPHTASEVAPASAPIAIAPAVDPTLPPPTAGAAPKIDDAPSPAAPTTTATAALPDAAPPTATPRPAHAEPKPKPRAPSPPKAASATSDAPPTAEHGDKPRPGPGF